MSPSPKRQPMVRCPSCGAMNDPARGSNRCVSCNLPLASAVQPFQFPVTGQQVRVVDIDGEPWIVLADACAGLGLSNASMAAQRLEADDLSTAEVIDSMGRQQQATVVNESGLYGLIFQSRRPEAKAFRRWITHEVLPAIHRTGSYGAAPALPDITTPAGQHAVAQMLVAATAKTLEQAEQIAELAPDAARARQTLDAHGLSLVGTVAKRFGIKEKTLREFLFGEGLLIRNGTRRNEPYARYIEAGHFELKTRLVEIDPDRAPEERSTTYVTPRGEALIWRRLHGAGLVSTATMPGVQLAIGGA